MNSWINFKNSLKIFILEIQIFIFHRRNILNVFTQIIILLVNFYFLDLMIFAEIIVTMTRTQKNINTNVPNYADKVTF